MIASAILVCARLLAVDGDTVKCDGQNLRPMGPGLPFVSGFDAPEIFTQHANCLAEQELGFRASARMAELLQTPGLVIEDSGERDDTAQHRPLVWLRLPDGMTIGETLLAEGLAKPWLPGQHIDWCVE